MLCGTQLLSNTALKCYGNTPSVSALNNAKSKTETGAGTDLELLLSLVMVRPACNCIYLFAGNKDRPLLSHAGLWATGWRLQKCGTTSLATCWVRAALGNLLLVFQFLSMGAWTQLSQLPHLGCPGGSHLFYKSCLQQASNPKGIQTHFTDFFAAVKLSNTA